MEMKTEKLELRINNDFGGIDEMILEVPTNWLERKVSEKLGMILEDFLGDFPCDDVVWLYDLAIKENQIISSKQVIF